MRRGFLWGSFVCASAVVIGIILQLYFIAAWVFGASGALTAHKDVGSVVHALEVLTFVAGLVAWWRNWRNVAMSFGFALLGTIQVVLVGDLKNPGSGWLHGLHGGLALLVAGLAVHIAVREARALGLRRAPGTAPA